MGRKIYVTAEEMLELRRQGLSNHDIAKSLDISLPTVLRYIGKQNGHMEGLAAFKDAAPRKKEQEVVPMIPKYEPKAYREWYEIGKFNFEVNPCARAVGISKGECFLTVGFDDVPDLVEFLAWAMRERMEVNKDGEQVREQEDDSEWGDV